MGNCHVQKSLPRIPVNKQKHAIQTSHLILLIHHFAPSSNQYGAAHSVQRLVYMLEDLEFKSRQEQENNKTSTPVPVPTQPPTQRKQELFLWQ